MSVARPRGGRRPGENLPGDAVAFRETETCARCGAPVRKLGMEAHLRGAPCKLRATRLRMREKGWAPVPEGETLREHKQALRVLEAADVPFEVAPSHEGFGNTVTESFWAPEWACVVLHVARRFVASTFSPGPEHGGVPHDVVLLLRVVAEDEELRGAVMAATELSSENEDAVLALLGIPREEFKGIDFTKLRRHGR